MGIHVNVNLGDIAGKVNKAKKFAQVALDEQVLKDSNRFIPFDTGNLRDSSIRASQPGTGKVVWDTPYARRLYYNPQYNFSKDQNTLARGRWFDAAKAQCGAQWVDTAQNGVNEYFANH
ncbi:minor capsid protein [Sporolactobacillus sp. CQH2019]|uniref:minor capsid protein n=1 Tax=Sporolactobacillus sp. CQH2019 TaxID=3023512 RepID=UPI0023683104|nr:minor capsid protein [Sporolactobacillus sp. CQH2019]MDD9147827.1 minor capsid protein [Sporolactobacillus sp. CQH2019]